jgi:hypothetical protein
MKTFFFQHFNSKKLTRVKIDTLNNDVAGILSQPADKQNNGQRII